MSLLFAIAQAALATTPVPASSGLVDYPPAYFEAAHPSTAREMLDRIPGFTFDGGESVRGYEGAAGNVLVDGQRPAAKTDTLDAILRRIPTSSVAHIEIIRGGASGVDMQGRSVLANVVLRKEAARKFQVISLATYQPGKGRITPQMRIVGSGGGNGRKWEFSLFGGSYVDGSYGDGPTLKSNAQGTPIQTGRSQSHAGGQNYQFTGSYELPLAKGQLRLNGLVRQAPFDDDISNRALKPASYLEREHVSNDTDSSEFGLRYSRDLDSNSQMEVVVLRQAEDIQFADVVRSPTDQVDFSQDSKTEEKILRGVWKQRLRTSFSWELGAEAAANTLHNRIAYIANGQKISLPSANVTVTESRYEAIAKAVWSPDSNWTAEADLRQELSEIASKGDTVLSKSLSYTKPRLAFKWNYGTGDQIRFRLEREVGQLKFADFTATSALKNGVITAGNPDLAPEQGWVTELTSEHQVLRRGAIVITGRHASLSDVIDRAPIFARTGVIDSPANIGSGTKDELSVNATLPLDSLGAKGVQLQSNMTWRRSRVTDPTTHLKRSISNLPDKSWDVLVTWDLPRQKLNLSLSIAEEMESSNYRFDQVELLKVSPFVKVMAVWTPDPRTVVRLEVHNITSQSVLYAHDVYQGARSGSGIVYRDSRQESLGRFLSLGIRRTF